MRSSEKSVKILYAYYLLSYTLLHLFVTIVKT